jgi:hypothetical protein
MVASLCFGKAYKKDATDYIYAARGEKPVVVSVKGDIIETVNKKAEDLREKKVFPFKSWEVHTCDLVLGGSAITLAKDESGKWKITAPITARANANKIFSFISSLSQLEALDFITPPSSKDELATYGLKDPSATITLYEKGEKKIGTIRFGKGKGEKEACYAIAEEGDSIYKIKPEFMNKDLPATLDEIREKKLLDFSRYQVARIEATDGGKRVVLEKSKGSWKLTQPESRSVEEKDVNELVTLLSDLEANRFISQGSKDLASFGLDQPGTTITLKNDKGEGMATLLLSSRGPEDDTKTCYAKEAKDTWVGLVKVDSRKKIQERVASLAKNKG